MVFFTFLLHFFVVSLLALCTVKSSEGMKATIDLARIRLSPVLAGAIAGESIESGSLWSSGPVMLFVIRRPG